VGGLSVQVLLRLHDIDPTGATALIAAAATAPVLISGYRRTSNPVQKGTRWFMLGAALFSVLAAGLQVGCLVVSRELLGLRSAWADNVSANVVGMALATAFRFWTFRTFVFRADRAERADGADRAGRGRTDRADRESPTSLRPAAAGTPAPAGDAARSSPSA